MKIELYANVKLSLLRNFAVDDIVDYIDLTIDTPHYRKIDDLNYFKHRLDTTILLELGQAALDFDAKKWNYCKITNGTEKPAYYFIIDMEWRSKEVVVLKLRMDSITTIGFLPLTKRTLIHREHKDRFQIIDGHVYPLIDKTSEGIAPILYKVSDEIEFKPLNGMKWYIAYITDNEPSPTDYTQINPVKRYYIPEYGADFPTGDTYRTVLSDYEDNKYYIFSTYALKTNAIEVKIDDVDDGVLSYNISHSKSAIGESFQFLQVRALWPDLRYTVKSFTRYIDGTTSWEIVRAGVCNYVEFRKPPYKMHVYKSNSNTNTAIVHSNIIMTPPTINGYAHGLSSIDLTNSKIIKIVEIPYAPFNCEGRINEKDIVIDANVDIALGVLTNVQLIKLRDNSDIEYLKNTIELNSTPFNYSYNNFANAASEEYRITQLYNKFYESKLLSIEFYNAKFVYDSFSYLFDFSIIDIEDFDYENFKFSLKPSESIGRDFLFDFTDYVTEIEDLEDYSAILPVSRNNEIALYSSDYINYMRTGYNYDVKAKETRDVFSMIGAATGATRSLIQGAEEGGGAAILSSLNSLVSTLPSMLERSILEENAMEKQLATLRRQKTNVSTEDDLSLMHYYTRGGQAKFVEYAPSEAMQQSLLKLFHYSGYKCEYLGVPSLNSRLRFNYIKADIDIDETSNAWNALNMPKEIIEDYKERFRLGLTIFHNYDYEYDFEQKYENWETILESYLTN